MKGHLTARDWLRERRRVITLLGPVSPDVPVPARDLSTAVLAVDRRQAGLGQRAVRRRPLRQTLTLLSLSRLSSGRAAPEAPWPTRRPRRLDPEITHTDIWLNRLAPAFEGLKIVHLTDIHHSLYTPLEEVERAVQLANRLEPDLIALTGDYVTLSPAFIRPVALALGKLRARRGVFAVLGNHDFKVDPSEVTRALRDHHIRVLRNSSHRIRAAKETLWLVGVDDLWEKLDDLPAALRSIPPRDPKILLCHNPLGIRQASNQGVDLVLSGHTHGGQVRLPGFRSLYRSKLGERFVEGWNRLDGTQIYVNRGIGKVVVPIRLDCPAEIACLRLRRGRRDSGTD